MNLAELQLLQMKASDAAQSLNNVYSTLEKDVKADDTLTRNYFKALYYVYTAQAKILMKTDASQERSALTAIVAKYSGQNPPLFLAWNFTSYVTWLRTNPKISDADRKEMLDVICPCLAVSSTPVKLCF
jgi:hypothetical protein